jgi:hypothetical protein
VRRQHLVEHRPQFVGREVEERPTRPITSSEDRDGTVDASERFDLRCKSRRSFEVARVSDDCDKRFSSFERKRIPQSFETLVAARRREDLHVAASE